MNHRLPLVLALLATPALSQETRQLESHEHGVGELNIALQGNTIAIPGDHLHYRFQPLV